MERNFLFDLVKILGGGIKASCVALAVFCTTTRVEARVCFLPGNSLCDNGIVKAGLTCTNYDLPNVSDYGGFCQQGWDCRGCRNAQGMRYKCRAKATPEGFTAGKSECGACEAYTYNGCTGSRINGKCTPLEGYSTKKPGHCTTYVMPEYTIGVDYSGATAKPITRNDCYYNVVPLQGGDFKTAGERKLESCKKYDAMQGTDGEWCYANARSIGDNYSTRQRDEAFTVDKDHGTDKVDCYRAKGCNVAKNWVDADKVDSGIFTYTSRDSDGVYCRHPVGCNEKNGWHATVSDPASAEKQTVGGQTCYKLKACSQLNKNWKNECTPKTCSADNATNVTCDLVDSSKTNGLVCYSERSYQCPCSYAARNASSYKGASTCDDVYRRGYYEGFSYGKNTCYIKKTERCPGICERIYEKYSIKGSACVNQKCSNNSDCGSNQFCYILNYKTTGANNDDYSGYYTDLSGYCVDVSDVETKEIDGFGTVYYTYPYFVKNKNGYGNTAVNWWTARNWCSAIGKKLIDANKFGCYKSGTSEPVNYQNLTKTSGGLNMRCCPKDTDCSDGSDFDRGNNWRSIPDSVINILSPGGLGSSYFYVGNDARDDAKNTYLFTSDGMRYGDRSYLWAEIIYCQDE